MSDGIVTTSASGLRWSEPYHDIQHLLDVATGVTVTVIDSGLAGAKLTCTVGRFATFVSVHSGSAMARKFGEEWASANGYVEVQP